MKSELELFHEELLQDVLASADADGAFAEDAFFDRASAIVIDAGDLEAADRTQYVSPRGLRADGYGGDPLETDGVLTLILMDFHQDTSVGTLTRTEMDATFKRGLSFVASSLKPKFRDALEETSPAYGLADLIAARWPRITKIRLVLLTNKSLSSRVDGAKATDIEGVPVTHSVWDLDRMARFVVSGRGREDLIIDLIDDFGGPLPVLPAHFDGAGYEAYLAVVPGRQLAAIYERWGARLLEQNVRVFLQARGNVNKGIRVTLENEPAMFFAFNNGITATAESVELVPTETGMAISSIRNLQIVNGGQTTASIHAAGRSSSAGLSKVFVQMKLSIVEPDEVADLVPRISEYANTQNRVNAADFFANHPYHIRMEEFSRRIYAPSPDGTFRESKWFYERARGQYQDARANLTASQRKAFDLEYPKRQLLSKTDLAKFLMVWRQRPDLVSRGAQKNFVAFAEVVSSDWSKDEDQFNEAYYREAIAKAILFRATERIVTDQPWYEGGYRANVVAYALAKMAHDVAGAGVAVDFERIWLAQQPSDAMSTALIWAAEAAHGVIVDPPSGHRNITEWAKQQACWHAVSELEVQWPEDWLEELLTAGQQRDSRRAARREQKVLNDVSAEIVVVQAGAETWAALREWGLKRRLLSPTESGILEVCASMPTKLPTAKQSARALAILARLRSEGCQLGADIGA